MITICIYINDEKLKEDAKILAALKSKSFSKFVWDTLRAQVEDNRELIDLAKKLKEKAA